MRTIPVRCPSCDWTDSAHRSPWQCAKCGSKFDSEANSLEGVRRPAFIVAEISRNYIGSTRIASAAPDLMDAPLISEQFETVIKTNVSRGYVLDSWKLDRVLADGVLNETIIAVFKDRDA